MELTCPALAQAGEQDLALPSGSQAPTAAALREWICCTPWGYYLNQIRDAENRAAGTADRSCQTGAGCDHSVGRNVSLSLSVKHPPPAAAGCCFPRDSSLAAPLGEQEQGLGSRFPTFLWDVPSQPSLPQRHLQWEPGKGHPTPHTPHLSPEGLPEGTAPTVSDWEPLQSHPSGSEGKCLSRQQVSCRWGPQSRLCLPRSQRNSRDGAGAALVSAEGGAEPPSQARLVVAAPNLSSKTRVVPSVGCAGQKGEPCCLGRGQKGTPWERAPGKSDPRTARMWHLPLALNARNSSREQSWFPERLTLAFVPFHRPQPLKTLCSTGLC